MAEAAAVPAVPDPVADDGPAAPPPQEGTAAGDDAPAAEEAPKPNASPSKPKAKAAPKATVLVPTPGGGGRQRKNVEHFKPEEVPETKKLTVQEGEGTKLRDIPNVHFKLSKISGAEEIMELLHDVMFKRKGKASTRKRDILDFSGYTFATGTEKAELEKVTGKLKRLKAEALHQLLDIFELPRGSGAEGHKDAKVQRIADWLQKPAANSDKDLAAQALKKREVHKRKAKREAAKKREARKRKAEREEKAKANAAPKPKKAKTGGDGKEAAKSPKKASAKARKPKAPAAVEEGDSDDELPLAVAAKLPSDKALVKQVQSILSKVNVQEFNLKALMAKLAEHYGTDLAAQKPLIKTTAIQYCLDNSPSNEEEEEAEEEADEAEEEEAEGAEAEQEAAEEAGGAAEEEEAAEVEAQPAADDVEGGDEAAASGDAMEADKAAE